MTGELLAGYLAGEREAERRLFERFQGELHERARRHPAMGPLAAAFTPDDIVQDAFLRALGADLFARFEDRGPGALGALLGLLVERVLQDHARSLGALKHGGGERPGSLDATEGDAPAGARLTDRQVSPTADVRARDLLQRCRALLDGPEWDLWRLVEVDGLRAEDLAALMDRTPAAIRGVLFRARLKLAAGLAADDPRGGRD